MLTSIRLHFRDSEMKEVYAKDNHRFYSRAVLLITVLLFVGCSGFEMSIQSSDTHPFSNKVFLSIVSWTTLIIFSILNFIIRRALWTHVLICPLLTIYLTIFFVFINGGNEVSSVGSMWAETSVGTAVVYYVLIMLNESWYINLAVVTPCIGLRLYCTV
jgi:hypothetical protein